MTFHRTSAVKCASFSHLALLVLLTLAGCSSSSVAPPTPELLARAVRTENLAGCAWASPVVSGASVIVATGAGEVVAYRRDGSVLWHTILNAAAPEDRAWIAATPVVVDGKVVVAWQSATASLRHSHHVLVLDAATGALDATRPRLTLAAKIDEVSFNDETQFSRSTLIAANGKVYVSFGNIQDIQPWHGWIYEIDLATWQISTTLLTTPETHCPVEGESGSLDMICGGGIWAPSGPQIVDGDLWVPTGNGQLDLARHDYANTVMRVKPGLKFDPHCNCPTFDPHAPDRSCVESCADMFIPRLREGDPPLAPPSGLCAGMTFFECYARLDLDLGANSPVVVEAQGKRMAVLPAKDGAVYLFDTTHFGTLYDRLLLRDFCGTHGGTCTANWAGTMVTQPAVAQIAGAPVVIIPTFYFDAKNPAGVVALDIAPGPKLVERWSAPPRESPEAIQRFREHTGRVAILQHGSASYAVIADPGPEKSASGILYAIDARDGTIVSRGHLDGPGHKYILPAILEGRVFVTSCDTINDGPTHLEGWDMQ